MKHRNAFCLNMDGNTGIKVSRVGLNIFYLYGKAIYTFLHIRKEWILRGPQSSSFWVQLNLSDHIVRQTRTGAIVFVKSREMTGRTKTVVVAGRRRGKDDRKQNTLAPLLHIHTVDVYPHHLSGTAPPHGTWAEKLPKLSAFQRSG